jgi:hypothetical protein
MLVVARSLQILRGIFTASVIPRVLAAAGLWIVSSSAMAQEALTPEPATPVPASEPVPGLEPVPQEGAAPAAVPVDAGCLNEILAQQKLTRATREIRNPLPRPAKVDKRGYLQFLAAGFSSPAETKVVQDYLESSILQASDPVFSESTRSMQNLIDDVKDDVARAGSGIGNATNQAAARKKYCSEVLKIAKKLLDNNLDSRLAAVRIMHYLYEVMPVQNGAKARLHPEALTALLAVLNDPAQPDSVKVVTASSLRNILMNCDVVEIDQFRICDAIGKELSRPCSEAAFQLVLIDTVYEINKPRRTVGTPEPTVLKVLANALNDRSKPVEVRCHAARGIGRGAFDTQMKLDPFAWKITQLAGDAAVEFTKSPGNPKWPECGIDLLLAFRHNTQAESTAPVLEAKGLMNRDPKSKVIEAASPFITSVALKLIENKASNKFTVQDLTPLAQWIRSNQPSTLTWDTNAPPLTP